MTLRRHDADIAHDIAYSLAQALLVAEDHNQANSLSGVAVSICRVDGSAASSTVATENAVGDPRIQMAAALLHGALDSTDSPQLRKLLGQALRFVDEALRTRHGVLQSTTLH